jgi:hypothetical protein
MVHRPPAAPKKEKQAATAPKSNRAAPDDFVSVARRLECDEDKGRFEAKLGKIARASTTTKRGKA